MFLEEQNKLKKRLSSIIQEIGHSNDIKKELCEEFKGRQMSTIRAIQVLNMQEDVFTFSDSEQDILFLFIFTLALNNALMKNNYEERILVEDYFTNVEIDRWKNYKEDTEEQNIYPIIFENAEELGDGIWQCSLTAQKLNNLNLANLLIWNPKNQRGYKVTMKGIRINVDFKKVQQIYERIKNGEQFPDQIKINAVRNGNDKVVYNKKNRSLIIYQGTILNIFDGQHRKEANALAVKDMPEINFKWSILITNHTESKVSEHIEQINRQTKINISYLATLDRNQSENRIVDLIIDYKGELSKIMKDTNDFIRSNMGLTTKAVISQAIKDNYAEDLTVNYKLQEVADWINKVIDYIFYLYPDEFINNPYQIKEKSYINNKNMFYGYIALSAKVRYDENWKELVKQKLSSINFDIENVLWRDIGIIKNREINKTAKLKLYNLFREGK